MSIWDIQSLTGKLLIAMPMMSDPRFHRSVIYICTHSEEGAMGIVINRLFESLRFKDLLEQLKIPIQSNTENIRIHYGGPIESSRGFVLHSSDFCRNGTLEMENNISLTLTSDVLEAIASGNGPKESLLALGYAGWGPGQLDEEIQINGWLYTSPDPSLLFDQDLNSKWERSLTKIGIDARYLSLEQGRA